MSKYTDTTERMTQHIRDILDRYTHNFTFALTLSEPKNKDQAIQDEIKYRMTYVTRYADQRGYKVECTIIAPPPVMSKYNCVGCRKRKTGDYFWVIAKLKPLPTRDGHCSNTGWDQTLAKVCSKECGEMVILRIA